jgi:hypothetical protein
MVSPELALCLRRHRLEPYALNTGRLIVVVTGDPEDPDSPVMVEFIDEFRSYDPRTNTVVYGTGHRTVGGSHHSISLNGRFLSDGANYQAAVTSAEVAS